MDKFKIGDKVLSVRPDSIKERMDPPSWTPVMDETIGITGKVVRMNSQYIYAVFEKILSKGSFQTNRFAFRREWLKKFKRKIG